MTNIQSTKSILRQTQDPQQPTSWFSKLNTDLNPTPRLGFFGSFRKSTEDRSIDDELKPTSIRRVRFPIQMTTEYVFKRDDLVSQKVSVVTEPIQIGSCAQLLTLYELICRQKQEPTLDKLVTTLIAQPEATSLTRLDLSNQPLDPSNMKPFCDLLSIDFGLRELVLDNCGLEDETIKILAHSLLDHDRITHLSLARSKITHHGFRYLAIYLKESTRLVSLDLSYTQPDKKSIQYLTAATIKQQTNAFTLILDGCPLKAVHLEVLASSIRKPDSTLRNLSMTGQHRLLNQQAALSIGIMLRDYDNDQLVGLSQLTLDGQEMDAYGIQYIAQALRRNRQLKSLSMRSCKIDAKSCHLLGEALKYNQHLQQLDIACNPLCQPQLEGINQLAQALNINLSLKSLCLAETNLSTEAMIVLAESLPQNKSLVRLDVAGNHAIQMAGFMALAASLQMNSTITYVDVHTLDNDHDMMMLHHQMLAKCTQNAQSKQQNSTQPPIQAVARLTLEERLAAAVTRGKTMPKEVAEDNTKKQKGKKDEEEQWIQQAITYTESLEQSDRAALDQSKRFQQFLCTKIPQLPDTSPHLELLLAVNDRLTTAIEQFKEKTEPLKETVSATFEIGDDDDDFDEKNDRLKELRDEFEAEEGAVFLKAKKQN